MNPADVPMPTSRDACHRALHVSIAVRKRLQGRMVLADQEGDREKFAELRITIETLKARERDIQAQLRELPKPVPELARQLLALKRAIKAQFGEETLISLLAESARHMEAEDAAREVEDQ